MIADPAHDWRDRQDKLLLATLPHIPFEGWSAKALREGAADLGLDPTMAERLFPGGPVDAVEHFCDFADRRMVDELAKHDVAAMRVPDRIRLAIRTRFEQWQADREAVSRAVALLALPVHAPTALRCTYRTVDAMWWAAGDTSTDFNFYTKRATLAGVYSTTLMVWLSDHSDDSEESWAFLDRRLADIGRIPKARKQVAQMVERLPNPLNLLHRLPGGDLLKGVRRGRGAKPGRRFGHAG